MGTLIDQVKFSRRRVAVGDSVRVQVRPADPAFNPHTNETWARMRTGLVQALAPYPAARSAVVEWLEAENY
jgi:hypothetical protein